MKKGTLLRSILVVSVAVCLTAIVGCGDQDLSKASDLIRDTIILKLIMLDLNFNLVGIGWEDMERMGVPQDKLTDEVKRITKKYGIDLAKLGGSIDVNDMGGGVSEGLGVYVVIPDKWCNIISLEDSGKLVPVKFKSGSISINYTSMSVNVKDKTQCLINKNVYTYLNGNWTQKR